MPRSAKVWGMYLMLLAALSFSLTAQPAELDPRTSISLSSRVIDTGRPQPEIPAALQARPEDAVEDEIVLVKFPGPATARQMAALRAASLRIYTYLPYYAYLVKMPAGGPSKSSLAATGATWSGPYHPLYKLSPAIADVQAGEGKDGAGYRPVLLQVFPDADLGVVIQKLRDLGVKGIVGAGRSPFFSRIRLLLTPAEIAALKEPLAGLRDVFWIDLEGRRTLLNDTTIWVGQSGLSGGQTTPIFSQGIFGEGQTVGTSANSMASFSSCGPTVDGRIKPDVTIPGSNIISANNDGSVTTNNCGTKSSSGTSMASPGAAGLTALIRQYYTDGWYPTGSEISANGFTPSAALLKATLINSAVSMTGTTAIPANCQGWGRALLENALFFTGQTRKLWVKDNATAFSTGSTNEDRSFSFAVTAGEPLKVSLAWTDFPSTPAANPNLVNDLDLIVTGPTGTIWRGNVFSGGVSATGGAADRRNPLEQVLLASPAAGSYTVTVRSFNVPNGPQPFALVVTGNAVEGAPPPPPVTVFFDDFETSLGWTANPNATDTATTGLWERGDPEATSSGGTKQLGTTVSGVNDLVTGRLAGGAAGDHDIDGGVTSIRSPAITLPSTGTLTLSFSYYLAHATNSSTADFLRVQVVGTTTSTVLEELGGTENDNAVWLSASINISSFAGQTVRILIQAADAVTGSLVEAAVDDVRIVQQP